MKRLTRPFSFGGEIKAAGTPIGMFPADIQQALIAAGSAEDDSPKTQELEGELSTVETEETMTEEVEAQTQELKGETTQIEMEEPKPKEETQNQEPESEQPSEKQPKPKEKQGQKPKG